MLKTLITVSTVLLTTAAFAESNTKSPGSSAILAGTSDAESPTSTHRAPPNTHRDTRRTQRRPGHSESAPGHQSTTGSAATDRTKKK